MSSVKDHPLFQQYPLDETATLSVGVVPVPYHIYDGYGVFIGGTADLERVRALLQPEHVEPIQNEEGRALIGIWICNFLQASLGPHHELQFSIFIQRQPAPPVSTHRLGLLAAMLKRRDMQMLCHGLYNSTSQVVAYNRELLSLNAQLANSRIEKKNDHDIEFSIRDAATQKPLIEGLLKGIDRPSLRASFDLVGELGLMETFKAGRLPWVTTEIVNPLGVVLTQNRVAQAYTKNEVNAIQYFNPQMHTLRLGETPYANLDFQPQVVQYMDGFKFVYLNPE
jgi:hypothetical protein